LVRPSRQAVFLDRDGVLNKAVVRGGRPYPPASVDEMRLLPGVEEACELLRSAGACLFCITNQPDVARGATTRAAIDAINAAIRSKLRLDALVACYHDDADRCGCRKPAPGMIVGLAREFGVDPARSVMVGDRWRDIEAGRRAGCATVLIGEGYDKEPACRPDARFTTLRASVPWILEFLQKGASR
jgi:D-glycero-D-manno-heptose 1,7-bisphosphate phosphatase